MDSEGNAVALSQTINYFFGSGLIVPGTGIIMNNEMDDFQLILPPQMPQSQENTIIQHVSTIMEKDGEVFMVLGSPGATRILQLWHR